MVEQKLSLKQAVYSKLADTENSDKERHHPLKLFDNVKLGTMKVNHTIYMRSMSQLYSSFYSCALVS